MEEEGLIQNMAVQDVRKHNQLIDAIAALDGKTNSRQAQRSVLSNQISEFNFTGSKDKKSKVKLGELVGSLQGKGVQISLRKQIDKLQQKQDVVKVPAPKHEREKVQRKVAYEKTAREIAKWDPVVEQNRLADQMVFPLAETSIKVLTTDELVETFKPRTPLELEVAALLGQSDHVIKDRKDELTPAEKRALEAMDVEEARERRRELMKHRALLSYKQARDSRQKKIKSKSYRRVLKREKRRKEEKILAEMEKNDPEGFAEKMKLLDRQRIEERMTLKHRGGSKFGQRQKLYAKYDAKAREQVQNMLQLSRDLTKKQEVDLDEREDEDSEGGVSLDSEDEHNMGESEAISMMHKNPWMSLQKLKVKQRKKVCFSRPGEITDQVIKQTSLTESKESLDESDLDEDKCSEDNSEEEDVSSENTKEEGDVSHENRKKMKEKVIKSDKNSNDIEEIFKNFVPQVAKKSKGKKGKKKTETPTNTDIEKIEKESEDIDSDKNRTESNSDNETLLMERNTKSVSVDKTVKRNKILEKEGIDVGISESLNRKRTMEDFSDESDMETSPIKKAREDDRGDRSERSDKKEEARETYVDPKKLMTIESKIQHTGKGLTIIDDDDDDDAEEDQREMIAEAFADDDVIEEFMQEKEDVIEKKKVKDVDLTLPGWGDWGGESVKPIKKKRLIVKAPEQEKRKDHYIGHVIINEDKLKDVAQHQVEHIPFPHQSVNQYEASIRAPIGETWNTPSAFAELAKPKVVSRMGAIISPIDKSETFKNEEKTKNKKTSLNSKEKEGNLHKKGYTRKRFGVEKDRKKHHVETKGKKQKEVG